MIVNETTGEVVEAAPAITAVLESIKKGEFADLAGASFAALVKECDDSQKKGTFTIVLALEPDGQLLKLKAEFVSRPPKSDPYAAVFWPSETGALLRSDPNQGDLFR